MSKTTMFVAALVLQLAAQYFGGVWGAAIAGIIIGVVLRNGGAFRIAFGAGALAAVVLLVVVMARGGDVLHLATMLGGNFKIPAWAIVLVTLLLPALQAAGLAGGTARLLAKPR